MPVQSNDIRMDDDIKGKAVTLYAGLGLILSDTVNGSGWETAMRTIQAPVDVSVTFKITEGI